MAKNTTNSELFQTLEQIARDHFHEVTTLRTQNSDDLDFHDISVWEIRDALAAAYELGQSSCQHIKTEN